MINQTHLGLFLALIGIASCTNHTQLLYTEADQDGRIPSIIDTGTYPIQVVLPKRTQSNRLRVYIEGDGKAWATRSQPSTDPTPTIPLVSRLAAGDPTPAAYIARPCQYVMNGRCNYSVWTDRRFSNEAIESISIALDQVKVMMGVSRLELVGYSGGGTVALLLAARRSDVVSVQTLAGNLSPAGWVQFHRLSPLTEAIEPSSYTEKLRLIPQRHLVGNLDQVVPPALAQAYSGSMGSVCIEIHRVNASHVHGWESAWAAYRDIPMSCTSNPVRTQQRH